MDNENKDFELESQEMEPDTETVEETPQELEVVSEEELQEVEEVSGEEPQEVEEISVEEEPQEVEEVSGEEEPQKVEEVSWEEEPQEVEEVSEEEFDPTESEDFYSNLEAAIGEVEEPKEEELPELSLGNDLFANIGEEDTAQNESADMEEELFAGVDAALTEQIEHEFGLETELSSTKEKKQNKFAMVWKLIPKWTKVLVSVVLVLLLSVGLLFGTPGGRKLIYRIAIEIAFWILPEDNEEFITPTPDNTSTTPAPTADPNVSVTPQPTTDPNGNQNVTPQPTAGPGPEPTALPGFPVMDDENIINVLLIGEERMKTKTGRSDAMILVSVNLNGGPLKMVSFLRDTYVSIPNNGKNKLNAAYAYGGADLLITTIEQNFGIDIDSYVKVGFDGFENIIDQLGGLEIELTAKESEYLNTTGYISKPEERNTVAGRQLMSGAQVLGYCRVRYIPTKDGLVDDFGRTYRQRTVLTALLNKFKNEKLSTLNLMVGQCLQYVAVPSDLKELALDCLTVVIEEKMFEIDTMQIPQNGKYTPRQDLPDKNGNMLDALQFDISNVDDLQEFLYGE